MGNTIEREEGVENIVVRVSDQAINGQDKSGRKIDGLIMCVNCFVLPEPLELIISPNKRNITIFSSSIVFRQHNVNISILH